jgi:hypothetical protein
MHAGRWHPTIKVVGSEETHHAAPIDPILIPLHPYCWWYGNPLDVGEVAVTSPVSKTLTLYSRLTGKALSNHH